jgi:hypothetical protein
MSSKTPSLVEMKQTCAWKLVRSSNIGGDISDQNYLEKTVSLNTMTSFSLLNFQKLRHETDVNFGGAYIISAGVLYANPMVAWSPPLTGGLHANKKNEI